MTLLYALTTGLCFGAGFYLLMRRSWLRLVVGLGLLGHGVNLLVFASGGLLKGKAPLIPADQMTLPHTGYSDPLPQALVLTAIVIGFGAQVFLFVLARETYSKTKHEDTEKLSEEFG